MVIRVYRLSFPPDLDGKPALLAADAKPPMDPAADVANLIRDLVEPESWKKEPQAYIQAVQGRLVVRHRSAVHRQIDLLIEKLINAPDSPRNQVPMVIGAGAAF